MAAKLAILSAMLRVHSVAGVACLADGKCALDTRDCCSGKFHDTLKCESPISHRCGCLAAGACATKQEDCCSGSFHTTLKCGAGVVGGRCDAPKSSAVVNATTGGGMIKLAWSDCADSSTHGHITSLEPTTVVLGSKTSLSGKGKVDEAIPGATYKVDAKALGITVFSHTGDACKPDTITLPEGAGTINMKGLKCPISAGDVELDLDLTLSSKIPAGLARVTIDLTAAASSGDKALCVQIKTSPDEENIVV